MILSLLILTPLVSALASLLAGRFVRHVAVVGASLSVALASVATWLFMKMPGTGLRLVERVTLLSNEHLTIGWHVGVDGLSFPLILLTAILGLVAVLISLREVTLRERFYYPVLLGIIGAVIGVFALQDLILFFAAWEAVLVLMFLLILVWGSNDRQYAAMKFLLFTGLGSGALLLAIVILGASTGIVDLVDLQSTVVPPVAGLWAFGLILVACLIKMPIVPLHTWLPDAHVQAPTAGSVILAGALLKMGGYALIRVGTVAMPDLSLGLRTTLAVLATITILWGAFACLGQRHLKRLIAYSSIAHMGFVLLAISVGTSAAMAAATIEMVSHGLLSGLLFALAGLVHQRTGTFDLGSLSGLASRMPITAWLFVVAGLGTMGLPGTSGFIAEVSVFLSAFGAYGVLSAIPILGVALGGAYIVRVFSISLFGPARAHGDERGVSFLPFLILLILTVLLGVLPGILLSLAGAVSAGVSW